MTSNRIPGRTAENEPKRLASEETAEETERPLKSEQPTLPIPHSEEEDENLVVQTVLR